MTIGHKYSFDLFSHQKSVLKQTTSFDIPFRYPNKGGLAGFLFATKKTEGVYPRLSVLPSNRSYQPLGTF
jgi:hypothetical protein